MLVKVVGLIDDSVNFCGSAEIGFKEDDDGKSHVDDNARDVFVDVDGTAKYSVRVVGKGSPLEKNNGSREASKNFITAAGLQMCVS